MGHNYESTRTVKSEIFEGVTIYLRKMTEGRRTNLRKQLAEPNRRIREILKEQDAIMATEEQARTAEQNTKWLDLNDEYDNVHAELIDPVWINWGVKQIEGLQVDGNPLTIAEMSEWPSVFFKEVMDAVKAEAELNGSERKNSESPTTSGEVAGQSQKLTIVEPAKEKDSGETEIALPTSRTM